MKQKIVFSLARTFNVCRNRVAQEHAHSNELEPPLEVKQ